MGRKKSILMNRIIPMLLSFFLVVGVFGGVSKMKAEAATEVAVHFTGLLATDPLELYPLAEYTEEAKQKWTKEVEKLATAENPIMDIEEFNQLSEEDADLYCDELLARLLQDTTMEVQKITPDHFATTYDMELMPGYYAVLPKGAARVYRTRILKVNPGGRISVSFEEKDYSIPEIEASVSNRTNDSRGEDERLGTDESGYPLLIKGDELVYTARVSLPNHGKAYVGEQACRRLLVMLPKGIAYQDSLKIYGIEEENRTEVEIGSETVKQNVIGKCTAYVKKIDNRMLFLEKEDKTFLNMDGSTLATGELQAAIDAYNRNTKLELQANQSAGNQSAEDQNAEEQSTENQNDEGIQEEDLQSVEYTYVNMLTLEKEFTYQKAELELVAQKNSEGNSSGHYDLTTTCYYATSPVDQTAWSNVTGSGRISSYGLFFYVVDGDIGDYSTGEPVDISTEDAATETELDPSSLEYILKYNKRLEAVELALFSYVATVKLDGTEEDEIKRLEANYQDGVFYTVPNAYGTEEDLYVMIETVVSNARGEAAIGGLRPFQKYLIMESAFPTGYTISQVYLIINEDDWNDVTFMEGDLAADILWLNYEGYYLPDTGTNKTVFFFAGGLLLMILAVVLRTRLYVKISKRHPNYWKVTEHPEGKRPWKEETSDNEQKQKGNRRK